MPGRDERFLIVRLAAVGDAVMASTVARRIRDEHAGAHISWLCGAGVAPLVRHFADVDEVITVDETPLLRGGAFARLGELLPLWATLIGKRFTHVLLLHIDRRYRIVIAPLIRATVLALTPRDAHGRMNPIPGRYFGDEFARLLDGPEHRGPIAGHFPLGRLRPLRSSMSARDPMRPRIGLVPGGARNVMRESNVRRWPVDHYAAVARSLAGDGADVVLIGDEHDAWVRPSFAGISVTDRIGATSLPDTLAELAACDLVVSHDTGPMHLARMAGVPLLALFGPTMPSQFVIEGEATTVLWGGERLACRPCYDGREFADCANNLCMSSIDPAVVLQTARTLLARPTRANSM